MGEGVITRRDFMRGTAGATLAAALGAGIPGVGRAESTAKVVLMRHPEVLAAQGAIQGEILRGMLDEAVATLLGAQEPMAAWRRLMSPSDVVGIKSNSWHYLPTPRELEEAIHQRVLDVGVQAKNIAVDDRGVLRNPTFLNATALINVRPVRTHFWSGVGGCLKNYIMFVPNPSDYHGDACSDLAAIWDLPLVKGKTRLNVLCALQPQFHGRGPHFFDRRYVWPYKGLILSTDPVAADAVGAHLLQAKRLAHFGEDRSLDVSPRHIAAAERKHGLGVADLRRIELIRVGWMDDVLI